MKIWKFDFYYLYLPANTNMFFKNIIQKWNNKI